MKLLLVIFSILCTSFVNADTPLNDVPIERPPLVNMEIPQSEIVRRDNSKLVIINDPPPPPPPAELHPAKDPSVKIGEEQLNIDAENLNNYLEKILETVQGEIKNQPSIDPSHLRPRITLPNPANQQIEAIPNTVVDSNANIPGGNIDFDKILKDAQAQFDQFSEAALAAAEAEANAVTSSSPPAIENLPNISWPADNSIIPENILPPLEPAGSERNTLQNIAEDLSTTGSQLNTLQNIATDLSTTDNFDSDDAKRLVQLIEERRELLRQLRDQQQVNGNQVLDSINVAPFRSTQRLSGAFDDFGIVRPSLPPGMTPLVGNSIGVPVNVVTDSESQRNNRPSNPLADAGRVNAPANIRQIFRDDDNMSPLSSATGIALGPTIPPNHLGSSMTPEFGDDEEQRRIDLLAQRRLLEEQLARVSGQSMANVNTATPLLVLPSTPNTNQGRLPQTNVDDTSDAFGMDINIDDNVLAARGIGSLPITPRNIPGQLSSSWGNWANRNRNPSIIQSPTPTLTPTAFQRPFANIDDDSEFRSPNTRVPTRLPLSQLRRDFMTWNSLSPVVTPTRIPGLPSSLEDWRQGPRISLRQTRNIVGNRRQPIVQTGLPSFDDDDSFIQNRGSQFAGRTTSVGALLSGRRYQELQNVLRSRRGVSATLGVPRPNTIIQSRNNPFRIPGVLSAFDRSGIDDDSISAVGSNIRSRSGFSSSLSDIRQGIVSQTIPPRSSLLQQTPIPPSTLLSNDDDVNTGQAPRTETRFLSRSNEEFPEFSRQVEQLLQSASGFNSVSVRGFDDDVNFRRIPRARSSFHVRRRLTF